MVMLTCPTETSPSSKGSWVCATVGASLAVLIALLCVNED
jgi:hypothetical protein